MDYDVLKLRTWVDKGKIKWSYLSFNPNAIHLLEQNVDKINWVYLSANPNAMHLLEQNVDKIDWYCLSENPNIFERDYIKMSKTRTWIILEDLMKNALHPRRLIRFIEFGGDMMTFK